MKKISLLLLLLSSVTMMSTKAAKVESVGVKEESTFDVPVQKVQHAIRKFKSSAQFNESTAQQLLSLLQAEDKLVCHLLDGEFGYRVAKDTLARNKLLATSIPSVIALYDAIMNLATEDEKLDTPSNKNYLSDGKPWKISLCRLGKVDFLYRMHDTLSYYHDHLRSLQWELAERWMPNEMKKGLAVQQDSATSKVTTKKSAALQPTVQFCPVRFD